MRLRHLVYPALDPHLRRLFGDGVASAYQLETAEFVGESDQGIRELTALLHEVGYEPTRILAASKRHPYDYDRLDDAALRRVDPERPRAQYHVHLFERGAVTEIYSHYEYRPDLWPVAGETLRDAIWRAREHLSPSWGPEWGDGTTYVMGRCDSSVAALVSAR